MRDRESTKILLNGATRYGIYDSAGNLLRHEYIRLEDEPTVPGSLWNRENVLPDDTVARLFDSQAGAPDDPQVKDALERLNHEIGEIVTTRRTDLGDHWALCNGEYLDVYKAPALYRMSRENYEYDIVHELAGKLTGGSSIYVTTESGAVVVNNTVYQVALDVTAAVINLYKWEGDEKSYGPVLVQVIACTNTTNHINISKCDNWVFLEAGYMAQYSYYKRSFFAANQSEMQFYPISYLTEGSYAFNNGVGDYSDGISSSNSTFVYCKIKSDGTMGMVMTFLDNYSNSSSMKDRYRMNVLEFVNGKWMCVKALTTNYFAPSSTSVAVAPFYNPYLGLWQFCYQTNNDTYVNIYSIDVAACYETGVLSGTVSSGSIWARYDSGYMYGAAYDTGSAIWLIPDYYEIDDADNNYVIQIDSITAFTELSRITSSNYVDTIRLYNGKIYGFSAYRSYPAITVFDTVDDLISNTGTVLVDASAFGGSATNLPPVIDDIAFGQGLYDHVLTGEAIETPGYKLPAIAPDAAYAYIKIKEAPDD